MGSGRRALRGDRQPFATVDLRVDLHPEPVAALRRLADRVFPLIPYYALRPLDPTVPRAQDWLDQQQRPDQTKR